MTSEIIKDLSPKHAISPLNPWVEDQFGYGGNDPKVLHLRYQGKTPDNAQEWKGQMVKKIEAFYQAHGKEITHDLPDPETIEPMSHRITRLSQDGSKTCKFIYNPSKNIYYIHLEYYDGEEAWKDCTMYIKYFRSIFNLTPDRFSKN